jgi:hypothetical protein
MELDQAEGDLHNSRRVWDAESGATFSHFDLLERDVEGQDNGKKWVIMKVQNPELQDP